MLFWGAAVTRRKEQEDRRIKRLQCLMHRCAATIDTVRDVLMESSASHSSGRGRDVSIQEGEAEMVYLACSAC